MIGTLHIVVAMKPLEGTFAENALKHGVAGLNIDGSRIFAGEQPKKCKAPGWDSINKANAGQGYRPNEYQQGGADYVPSPKGRWPANVILDGSEEVVDMFPDSKDGVATEKSGRMGYHGGRPASTKRTGYGGEGSAARFFFRVSEFREQS